MARFGKLSIEAGGSREKVGPVWLPDGLHVWWGDRGMHAFWKHSPHMRRVTFETVSPNPEESKP